MTSGQSTVHAYHCQGNLGSQPLHCHEEVEFVHVYRGYGFFRSGRFRFDTGPDTFLVATPQEVHAGTPNVDDFGVRGLNVSCEWFDTIEQDWRLLWQKELSCGDTVKTVVFARAYDAVCNNHSVLTQDEALLALCQTMGTQSHREVTSEHKRIRQAATLLQERFADDITLSELAATVELSSRAKETWDFAIG